MQQATCAGAPVIDAILEAWGLIDATPFEYHAEKITICGIIYRHLEVCPVCGKQRLAGTVEVKHQDGRSVSFDVLLVHYAEAGHPIAIRDIDGDTLVVLVADA